MHTEERTFVAVKPDGVQSGLVGEIIKRFETKGYKIVALKMIQVTDAQARAHYEEHKDKPFFPNLIKYLQSGPIVAMVVQGYNAVAGVRHLMGSQFRIKQKLEPSELILHKLRNTTLFTGLTVWKVQKEKLKSTLQKMKFVKLQNQCLNLL